MFSKRTLTLTLMMIIPLVIYLGLGAYALWLNGMFARTFWILPGCWLITWLVSIFWTPSPISYVIDQPRPAHLTQRDEDALQIVKSFQMRVETLSPQELTDPQFYLQVSQELARELAQFYHPKSSDPISELTAPEILAAMRLAIDDMERWMLDSVPGSQMVTIKQWRWLQHAPRLIRGAQQAGWLAGLIINPANALKYLASQVTVGPITEELQMEVLAAAYLRFIRQAGFYLIEMNSGRLRGGADRYRAAFGTPQDGQSPATPSSLVPQSLTIAFVGQVKAGKSSLINTLMRERVAKSDVLPETRHVTRYQMTIPDSSESLTLLDTPGYADAGATKEQLREVKRALREADVAVLVMDAHSPARSADRTVSDELKRWYQDHPEYKVPPVLICLTHIDLLSPMMEWKPPYDWRAPKSRKEQSIHDAVEHVRSLFQDIAQVIIPVCSDVERGRNAQALEDLLPALLKVLPEGKTAALLRAYHQDLNRGQWSALLKQIRNSGQNLLQVWMEERLARYGDRTDSPER